MTTQGKDKGQRQEQDNSRDKAKEEKRRQGEIRHDKTKTKFEPRKRPCNDEARRTKRKGKAREEHKIG
jgi:hypothetical protein